MDAVRAVAQASPAVEMAVVRLVHGAFSVLSVYFAYRILERVAGREAARVGGLLLATFYLLPATSVHQFERSEEHTSELQSRLHLVCRLLLEKKKKRAGS